jgi:hypothetical protein
MPVARLARRPPESQHPARRAKIKNYVIRKKSLRYNAFFAVFDPFSLGRDCSECHAVANGRDTPDSGRRREDFDDRSMAAKRHGRL